MTSLRKLGLRGVRSYSQQSEESIEFLKPLTIIVGANGAGKTSIIESLKFVTTGALPPLSDGGKSFVHDPKMDGTNLVKAQVKLSFMTADGKTVLAIRNFQLSQKKAKREFKGMEAVLSTKDEFGHESSVSHKCADIEKLVPQLMGVSPAVHQEDSLWPLSDGKTLKEKFDDIFAATRYTKALENIAKLRKEKAAEIRVMETELKALESNVEAAHKLEDDLETTKTSIKKRTDESDRVGDEIKAMESKLAKLGVKQEEIRAIQDSIATLQAQKDVMIVEKQKANAKMVTDYSDTDEELKNIYANFRTSQVQLLKSIEEKQTRLKQLEAECVRSEAQMGKLSEDLGKLQAQETDYKRKKQELSTIANNLGASSSTHSQLLQQLESALKNKSQELDQAKMDAQKLNDNYERTLSELKAQETGFGERTKMKEAEMGKYRARRTELVKQIADLESSARALQSVHEKLKVAQAELDQLSRTHDPDTNQMKTQIDTKMRTIQTNTQKLTVLSAQRKQLASQAESLAQIKLKRSQLQNLLGHYSTALETLKHELEDEKLYQSSTFPKSLPVADRLKDVFSDSSEMSSEYHLDRLERALKEQLQSIKSELKSKMDQVTQATAQVSSFNSQRKGLEEQMHKLKQQLQSYRNEFVAADAELFFSGTQSQLEEEIARANKLFEKASNEQMLGSSAKLMYKRFLGIARDSHKCYLCNRDFANPEEENQFVTANTDKMEKLVSADKADRNKAATKAAKTRLEQLQALMPIYLQAQQLQNKDLPKLESQLLQLQSDIAVASSQKSTAELELKDIKQSEEGMMERVTTAAGVARVLGDLQSMYVGLRASEKKLQSEAAAASDATGGKLANLEVVTNEYEAIEKLNVTLQRECNSLQEQLEKARTDKQKLIERVNQLKEESNVLARVGDDKERLRRDEEINNKAYAAVKEEVQRIMVGLPAIQAQISGTTSEREAARKRSAEIESNLLTQRTDMQRQFDQYRALVTDVERFEKQLKDRAEMKEEMTAKQQSLTNMRADRARLQSELKTDQERAAQNEKIDLDIKANLDYRERERAIVMHQKKIDERTAHLREVSGGELLDDLRHLQAKLVKAKEKKSELRGAMQSEAKQCEDLIASLTSDRYRHIDQRYKTKLIDVKTHLLANADLETYHRALDKALMFFHSLKMKEINETLKDYWRTVYKGSDIDEIYIVSDGAVVGSRRNYNYRVVMKQGDTELDMRGRCSAGQKVLASLLIRLALADTFCSQCAVLALDEPTTNLDHKNITAFAQALNQIIEKRREQSNFQLIVITHDETFVDEIGKRAHAEYYYRVYKDNAQHSKIRKQQIEQEDEH